MTNSYWQIETPRAAPRRSLPTPQSADIAIIGAGLAGLTTAVRLLEADAGLDIAILEAEFAGFGASGRNGGLLSPLAAPVFLLGADGNSDHAWALKRLRGEIQHAADWLAETLPESESRRVTLKLQAMSRLTDSGIATVARTLDRAGIEHRIVADRGLKSARTLDLGANTVSPFRLVQALATHAEKLGARIYEGAKVRAIDETAQGARIELESGLLLSAKSVLICTNAYTSSLRMPAKSPAKSVHNYLLATEPLDKLRLSTIPPETDFTVELNTAYVFYRRHENRVLFGGVEKIFPPSGDDFSVPPDVLKRLQTLLAKSLPACGPLRIAHAWGGKFQVTSSDLPVIGPVPGTKSIFFNVGYGGTGVAMTLACARLAAGLVRGNRFADGDDKRLLAILQSTRFPIAGAARFLSGVAWGAVRATIFPV